MISAAAKNPVFSNILMILIFSVGIYAFITIPRETFPNLEFDRVQISVIDRGASPEDVEEGICAKIEEEIQDIEGIRKVDSTAREGFGLCIAEVEPGYDIQIILSEIRTEVDKIDFGEEAEEPVVTRLKQLLPVNQLAIHGRASEDAAVNEQTLKEQAEQIREELLALDAVTQVEIFGTREYRVHVQVSEQNLEQFGLSYDDVIGRIQQESLTLPAGTIRSESGEFNVRTIGKRKAASEYRDIVLLSRADGSRITLGQVASVEDTFEEGAIIGRMNGEPSVQIIVFKTSEEDMTSIAAEVNKYVADKDKSLPKGLHLVIWTDFEPLLRQRLDLLFNNMASGLLLVFFTLLPLMGIRLSFWVIWGVPTAFLGAVFLLMAWGGTLNMISTFGFVLVVGMLVDDAIVISENVWMHYQRGKTPMQAAIEGTSEVWVSVCASVTTTMVAFAPAYFVAGDMGKVFRILPVVVVSALLVSLTESLLILPHHLAASLPEHKKEGETKNVWERFIDWFNDWFERMGKLFLDPIVKWALRFKGATIGVCLGMFAIGIGMVQGGIVEYVVFPDIDTDYIRCRFELPPGAPLQSTDEVARQIEESVARMEAEIGVDHVLYQSTTVGATTGADGAKGSHVGEILLALKDSSNRKLTASQTIKLWRETIGAVPGVERMNVGILDFSPAARPLEIRLIGKDLEVLRGASAMLKAELANHSGVVDIGDDDKQGKLEFQFRMKPEAAAQGVTVALLARQLRQSLFGATAVTVQRGREDVDVVVLLPEASRRHVGNIDDLKIRTPRGDFVPIHIVARKELSRSIDTIHRKDRLRVITVGAGIDETRNNAEKVLSKIEGAKYFEDLVAKNPGVKIEFGGQRGQTTESNESMKTGLLGALLGIYAILVLSFRSFLQPLIVMSIIPLSFFGAIIGHWTFNLPLSQLSFVGFIGLAGCVVNDAIELMSNINENVARGLPLEHALRTGSGSRWRAIYLTSSTTFMGLIPMVLEKSGQGKILVPMAVTIAFGILFETVFVLVLIPTLVSAVNDVRRGIRWLRTGYYPTPEEVEPAAQRQHRLEEEEGGAEALELPEEMAAFGPATPIAAIPVEPGEFPEMALPARPAAPPLPAMPSPGVAGHTRSISMADIMRPDLGLGDLGGARMPAPSILPGQITKILSRSKNVDTLLAEAQACSEKDDNVGALQRLLAVLRSKPDDADVHYQVGMLRGKLGDWRAAAASFDRALELDPANLDYREYRGWAALRFADYESAERDFSARIDVEPENLVALKGRATARMGLEHNEDAIADLDAAIAIIPRNADLFFLRGNAKRMDRQFKAAIADYDQVLSLRNTHGKALLNRGLCRLAMSDTRGALADFDEATRTDVDLHEATLQRGKAYLNLLQYKEATADFSAYLALRPDQTETYYFRGKARSGAGDNIGAVDDFQAFLRHNPTSKRRKMLEKFISQNAKAKKAS